MKILIDNDPLTETLPATHSFSEFCEKIMGVLLTRNLSIGTCEIDGTVVSNLAEADQLFSDCKVCKIASIPLAVAHGDRAFRQVPGRAPARAGMPGHGHAGAAGRAGRRSRPAGIPSATRSRRRSVSCRASPACSPRRRSTQLVDRELKELGRVMHALHAAFNNADTLEISDSIELRLLPWLRQQRAFLENCLQLVKTLHR